MNNKMAWWIVDQLVQQGVFHFCLAPGSRSTPLALAAAHHPKARLHVHYDERGVGFFALGIAKALGGPAAIIVTSGTAVGNLLPSVMEARYSYTPLILLTADRPPELQQAGANQTCNQKNIFSPFVKEEIDLPTSDAKVKESYVRSSIAHASLLAEELAGPVHINWYIREPLYAPPFTPFAQGKKIQLVFSKKIPKEPTLLKGLGVIAIGRLPKRVDLLPILQLAKKLRWPIFSDILSNARFERADEEIIHFDRIIKTPFLEAETVLHFGERLTSKSFLSWSKGARRIHVSPFSDLQDPERILSERIVADPEAFCASAIATPAPASWMQAWKEKDARLHERVIDYFAKQSLCSEAGAMHVFSKQFPSNSALYLGSGMPIRDANHLFFPERGSIRAFSNRGLSGIDGNIATAAGLAEEIGTPFTAWIGDQATLYDINSLPLLKKTPHPVRLIISNNFGGGIFSYLPVGSDSPHFETLFANRHSWQFQKAAELFDLPYTKAESLEEFSYAIAKNGSESEVIELITSRKENFEEHELIQTFFAKDALRNCQRIK